MTLPAFFHALWGFDPFPWQTMLAEGARPSHSRWQVKIRPALLLCQFPPCGGSHDGALRDVIQKLRPLLLPPPDPPKPRIGFHREGAGD